jgi:hypothetical protein
LVQFKQVAKVPLAENNDMIKAIPADRTDAISARRQTSHLKHPKIQNRQGCAINHAVRLIHAVCGLAGSPSLIDEIRAELRADNVRAAIRNRDTGPVFDWLMAAVSYQGISNQVAYE